MELQADAGVTLGATIAVDVADVPPTELQCATDRATGFPQAFVTGLELAGISIVERDSATAAEETLTLGCVPESASTGAGIAAAAEALLADTE